MLEDVRFSAPGARRLKCRSKAEKIEIVITSPLSMATVPAAKNVTLDRSAPFLSKEQ
jgi:hypothetical protein